MNKFFIIVLLSTLYLVLFIEVDKALDKEIIFEEKIIESFKSSKYLCLYFLWKYDWYL